MGEFRQLPLNLQFSNYMRYDNAQEMFADIERSSLWISAESYDSSVYPNQIYGFIFQGMHDYDHYLTDTDFSLEGEIAAYNFTAKRVPSLEIQSYSLLRNRAALGCLSLSRTCGNSENSFSVINDRGKQSCTTVLIALTPCYGTSNTMKFAGFALTVGQQCLSFVKLKPLQTACRRIISRAMAQTALNLKTAPAHVVLAA